MRILISLGEITDSEGVLFGAFFLHKANQFLVCGIDSKANRFSVPGESTLIWD